MPVNQSELTVRTAKRLEAIDISELINREISESGVRTGVCNLFAPHTTVAITVNEHFDPNVPQDILMALEKVAPEDAHWGHPEGNAPAHVKSTLISASISIPIRDGKLALGRWQGVYFMELDGPRSRQLVVTILS